MFVFFGDIKPKEWLDGADYTINIGNFLVRIQGNRISCVIDYGYVTDFDREIKEPAMLAMKCVQIAQSVETSKKLSIDYLAWIEAKLKLANVAKKFTLGHFLTPGEFKIDNREFLTNFRSGLRYANQAFNEMNMRVALEDYERTLDSEWDECIYHCQHCLEAVRDYFGEGNAGWQTMRKNLDLRESELRLVTDFSNTYIRHGSKRVEPNMGRKEKSFQAGLSQGICHAALDKFGNYLNENGVPFSRVK